MDDGGLMDETAPCLQRIRDLLIGILEGRRVDREDLVAEKSEC